MKREELTTILLTVSELSNQWFRNIKPVLKDATETSVKVDDCSDAQMLFVYTTVFENLVNELYDGIKCLHDNIEDNEQEFQYAPPQLNNTERELKANVEALFSDEPNLQPNTEPELIDLPLFK